MKLLRILTGIHAGASLTLDTGQYRISSDDDADIRLTDWQGADANLQVDETDVIRIARDLPDGAEQGTILLIDCVPMQFDEIVLCVGPEDTEWPSDLDLLSTLLASPVKSQLASLKQQHQRKRRLTALAACVSLGGTITAGALIITTQMSQAALPPSADERTVRVTQALAAAHIRGLHAAALGSRVVVTGMVDNTAEDSTARALLDRVATGAIVRKYDVAQEDVRSIQDSLGVDGVQVSYRGNGHFMIAGQVADKHQLEAAVARVRSDLDSNVKSLIIQVSETSVAAEHVPLNYSEMVSSEDFQYAETPDGVKHIFVADLPASDAISNAADPEGAAAASAPGGINEAVLNASRLAPASPTRVPMNSSEHATVTFQADAEPNASDRTKAGITFTPLPDSGSLPPHRGAPG